MQETSVGEDVEKGELLVGMQTGIATLANSMESSQKVKNRTTLPSSNHATRYLPQKYKNINSKDTCTPMFIAALFTIAKL